MQRATIEQRRGAKSLGVKIELGGGAFYDPVQWEDGSFHVAAVKFDVGGKYDPSLELAWTSFDTVAELTRAVIAERRARSEQ